MLRLKTVQLLRERVIRWDEYPFNIPPIASLNALEITSRICFFVGENGTANQHSWRPSLRITVSGEKAGTEISRLRPLQVCAPLTSSSAQCEWASQIGQARVSI